MTLLVNCYKLYIIYVSISSKIHSFRHMSSLFYWFHQKIRHNLKLQLTLFIIFCKIYWLKNIINFICMTESNRYELFASCVYLRITQIFFLNHGLKFSMRVIHRYIRYTHKGVLDCTLDLIRKLCYGI